MNRLLIICTSFLFGASMVIADDSPQPVTRTFYVSGVECGSCVYVVQQSVCETEGVKDAVLVQVIDNYANVTYDPRVVSEHQIAQAVREALPIHGMPYLATFKLRFADFTKNEAKVKSLFDGWKNWVEIEAVDKAKGEMVLRFLPLDLDKKKTGPQGWRFEMLAEAAQKAGLKFTLEQES
jgi:copper chaperone CopZ